MTRLLDRLQAANMNRRGIMTWSQRVCEQIEAAFLRVFVALASMGDIPDVTIVADYAGTVAAGQLPRDVIATRFTGTTDDTLNATWSFTVDSGALTATITNGVLTITAITMSSVVTITSDYNGVIRSKTFNIIKGTAPPPSTGGSGGTSAYDSTFASFNSTTHAQVSSDLTVTVAASGNVALAAPLTYNKAGPGPNPIWAKWQWYDTSFPTWVDVAAEVASSPYAVGPNYGAISVSASKTGLTVASSQKFRLMARDNAGAQVSYLYGTASAVSS